MPEFYTREKNESNDKKEDEKFDPTKTYLIWSAPARPYRKKHRSYYTTIAIIVILVILILFFIREFILICVVLALAFLTYVLGFVPPQNVKYRISAQGITVSQDEVFGPDDHFYFWADLDSFWFSEKEGFKILNILTNLRFPGKLIILINGEDQENIKKILARFIPYHEVAPKSIMDKWSEGLVKHFPLENPQS
jgi:hypothetical protein